MQRSTAEDFICCCRLHQGCKPTCLESMHGRAGAGVEGRRNSRVGRARDKKLRRFTPFFLSRKLRPITQQITVRTCGLRSLQRLFRPTESPGSVYFPRTNNGTIYYVVYRSLKLAMDTFGIKLEMYRWHVAGLQLPLVQTYSTRNLSRNYRTVPVPVPTDQAVA